MIVTLGETTIDDRVEEYFCSECGKTFVVCESCFYGEAVSLKPRFCPCCGDNPNDEEMKKND